MTIRLLTPYELKEAATLANRVFAEFVAPDYSAAGQQTFRAFVRVKYASLFVDVEKGQKKAWGCFQGDRMIGVGAIRDISHICMLFVDKAFHGQGVGGRLMQTMFADMLAAGRQVATVNASPFAVPIYHHWGFVDTDVQQEKDGVLYTPMRLPLPSLTQ